MADYNENESVETVCILDLLSEYGCTSNCITDLNADGNILMSDILIFLSFFGSLCP